MSTESSAPGAKKTDRTLILSLLLAMAMFVLVVDTSYDECFDFSDCQPTWVQP